MLSSQKKSAKSCKANQLTAGEEVLARRRAQPLSKSKLMAFRQCERRLWLEVYRPALGQVSASSEGRFQVGYQVGDISRRIYDPEGLGVLLDPGKEGYDEAIERTSGLLSSSRPIFEAGFSAEGARAFADVMLPAKVGGRRMWRMVEIKSSASVKDYHKDDAAIQAHVARSAGVPLASVSVAHLDSKWVYPGEGDYNGLLKEVDLTTEAFARGPEVTSWISDARSVLRRTTEPERGTGDHCSSPYECGFRDHCSTDEVEADFPVAWLPRIQTKALKAHVAQANVVDMRQVPDELLNPEQLRVKTQTIAGTAWFDSVAARKALKVHKPPMSFLDFETVNPAIPIWAGTRPYAQVAFQFSLHRLLPRGKLEHEEFIDLSGADPSRAFVAALVKSCGTEGPVFVYNAGFKKARMRELGDRLPRWRARLRAISERVVDLQPIARSHYYHPSQEGSWSIKKVLPAVVPELRYDELDGIQDGGAAMNAYSEAIYPETSVERKAEIRTQLQAYCRLDTYAMVRLWQVFAGQTHLVL